MRIQSSGLMFLINHYINSPYESTLQPNAVADARNTTRTQHHLMGWCRQRLLINIDGTYTDNDNNRLKSQSTIIVAIVHSIQIRLRQSHANPCYLIFRALNFYREMRTRVLFDLNMIFHVILIAHTHTHKTTTTTTNHSGT